MSHKSESMLFYSSEPAPLFEASLDRLRQRQRSGLVISVIRLQSMINAAVLDLGQCLRFPVNLYGPELDIRTVGEGHGDSR